MSEMLRRDALKVMAVASVATACGRDEAGIASAKPNPSEVPVSTSPATPPKDAPNPILSSAPLGFQWPTIDPFLFCVHHDDKYPVANGSFGPKASLAGRNMGQDFEGIDGWRMYHGRTVPGFPQHPHRGFETVTVVRTGLLDHSDSLGAAARYGGGDVQWLTAGAGILHAEMFPLLDETQPNPVELFQIWLNLPAADKFAEPYFAMLWNESIPRAEFSDANGTTRVTVNAGALGEHVPPAPPPRSWGARAESDVAIWTVAMTPGARWTLPPAKAGTRRMLYFFDGTGLTIAGHAVADKRGVELKVDLPVALHNTSGAPIEMLVLQGVPIAEPVAQHGPFVMNTREEIQQAFADYRRTHFGGWKWASDDPVHDREGRFARRSDGKVERPS